MIAASYCHRFYAAKSMVCNDYFTVATAALFLTFKVADLNPPLRKVLECSYNCHFSCDDASKKFLQDKVPPPPSPTNPRIPLQTLFPNWRG
mmetsp:Transcript_14521/g.34475  ORF Transcript_14521/g.34475 Transcript_14521/m.34475 type:complete len:91 (+) Transcript_14521:1009-1281(+)